MNALRVLLGLMLLILLLVAVPITNRDTRAVRSVAPQHNTSQLEGRDFVYYVIQPGDTMNSLEHKFRVASESRIVDLNPGLATDRLPTGHRIKIPL